VSTSMARRDQQARVRAEGSGANAARMYEVRLCCYMLRSHSAAVVEHACVGGH
jgi:hypothetical protein